jgi:hypothetical protein
MLQKLSFMKSSNIRWQKRARTIFHGEVMPKEEEELNLNAVHYSTIIALLNKVEKMETLF